MRGRLWNISVYKVTLLDGNDILVKNNSGNKVRKALERGFIKSFSLYKSTSSREEKIESEIDLDKIRSITLLHQTLVLRLYKEITNEQNDS